MILLMRGVGALWIFNVISLFHGSTNLEEIWDAFMAMQAVTKAGLVAVILVISAIVRSSALDVWAAFGRSLPRIKTLFDRARLRREISEKRPSATVIDFHTGKRDSKE